MLQQPNIHHSVQRNPQINPVQKQFIPLHIFKTNLIKIHSHISFHFTKWRLSWSSENQMLYVQFQCPTFSPYSSCSNTLSNFSKVVFSARLLLPLSSLSIYFFLFLNAPKLLYSHTERYKCSH